MCLGYFCGVSLNLENSAEKKTLEKTSFTSHAVWANLAGKSIGPWCRYFILSFLFGLAAEVKESHFLSQGSRAG